MKIAAVIPSRYESTRFPGKPLALIAGRTMIERVYLQVRKCEKFSDVIVATDDKRIGDVVEAFGGTVAYTSPNHTSGSERIWEVLENSDFDAVVNVQGDEPAVPVQLIADMYDILQTGKYPVVTPVYFNTSWQDFISQNIVKAVINQKNKALYFSRSPIPFTLPEQFKGFYHHVGMYGYLKESLRTFIQCPHSPLEQTEKLEQLRFLDNGVSIQVIHSQYRSLGVDVPEDINKIEEILREEHV